MPSDRVHAGNNNSKVLQAQSSISTLESSGAAAIGISKKRPRDDSDDHLSVELSKRRRLMHKPDIRKYGKAYAKAKLLGRTTKVHSVTSVSFNGANGSSDTVSRPRGRPSLKSKLSTVSQEIVEVNNDIDTDDDENQPRDVNGRFGRKAMTNGKFGRKKRRYTPNFKMPGDVNTPSAKRSRIDECEQDSVRQYKTTSITRSVKRLKNTSASNDIDNMVDNEQQQQPQESPVFGNGEGDDFDDRRDKTFWPALPPMPPVGLGFKRTGLLNMRPNPTVVSRWRYQLSPDSTRSPEGTPNLIDDTDDENDTKSDEHPATPDDMGSTRSAEVVVVDDSDDANSITGHGKHSHSHSRRRSVQNPLDIVTISESDNEHDDLDDDDDDDTQFRPNKVLPALKKFGLSAKPSPIALSKLKWAPKLKVVDSNEDGSPFPGQSDNHRLRTQTSKSPSIQNLNSRGRFSNVPNNTEKILIDTVDVFTATHEPLTSPQNLTFDAESSSSGEEVKLIIHSVVFAR